MSHGPMMSHPITHFSAPHSHSNTGYNTPHGPVARSGYNTPHGGMGYSHPSTGYNTPHSGIASGVMTPADLDLPLDLNDFEEFSSAGDGFQGFPVASNHPAPAAPTSQHHTQHYPPQPAQQQMVPVQQQQQQSTLIHLSTS